MKDYMPTNNMFDTNIKQSKSGCLCVGWNFNFLKMLIDLKKKKGKKRKSILNSVDILFPRELT